MATTQYMQGRIGQVLGPFDGSDLLAPGGAISKYTIEETDPLIIKLGIQAIEGTVVKINGREIKIGKTGIYELDEIVTVRSLSFPYGADEHTMVDFVY